MFWFHSDAVIRWNQLRAAKGLFGLTVNSVSESITDRMSRQELGQLAVSHPQSRAEI